MNHAALLLNPRAAQLYVAIPATADVGALADLFCRVSWHVYPDRDLLLALEQHVRVAASQRFHIDSMADALSRLERCIVARRYHVRQRARQAARESGAASRTPRGAA